MKPQEKQEEKQALLIIEFQKIPIPQKKINLPLNGNSTSLS